MEEAIERKSLVSVRCLETWDGSTDEFDEGVYRIGEPIERDVGIVGVLNLSQQYNGRLDMPPSVKTDIESFKRYIKRR